MRGANFYQFLLNDKSVCKIAVFQKFTTYITKTVLECIFNKQLCNDFLPYNPTFRRYSEMYFTVHVTRTKQYKLSNDYDILDSHLSYFVRNFVFDTHSTRIFSSLLLLFLIKNGRMDRKHCRTRIKYPVVPEPGNQSL